MRRLLLALAALLLLAGARTLTAQAELQTDYDSHIDKDGKLHCLNDGNKCRSW
jgi:hypothetical protein